MPKLKNILLGCFFTGAAGLLAQQPAPSSPSTTVSDTLLDLSCQPFIGTISLVLNSSDYRSSKTLSVAAGSFSVTLYPGTYSATLSSTTFGTTKRETWTVPNSGTTQTLANVGSPSAGIACPASLPPSGAASGDLSGTFPAPTVVKVNGTALPTSTNIVGTNASGQIVAQPNVNGITQVASNPATCAPGTTADVYNTTNSTRYYCSGTNTWSVGQSMGGTLVVGNTLSAPNLLTTGNYSGNVAWSGLTSGGAGWAVADVAGTAIVYVLPTSTPTASQYLQDSGATTCPTLPAGSPTLCHLLQWVNVPRSLPAVFVNGGSTLVPGVTVTKYLTVPVACTMTGWSVNAFPSGTISVDVWRVADGTALPTVSNTLISGSSYLSNVNTHIRSTTLTGFTVNPPVFAANDVIALNLQAVSGSPTWASVELICQ